MIFDRCYLLVNDEYALGTRSKDCDYKFLEKKIKNEKIFKILEYWGNKIKQWKYRNFLIHEGRHINSRLEEAFEKNFELDFDIMGMYLSNHSEFCKQNEVRKKMKKENWEKAISENIKIVNETMKNVDNFLVDFFSELNKRVEAHSGHKLHKS